jgi:hypothetical protein
MGGCFSSTSGQISVCHFVGVQDYCAAKPCLWTNRYVVLWAQRRRRHKEDMLGSNKSRLPFCNLSKHFAHDAPLTHLSWLFGKNGGSPCMMMMMIIIIIIMVPASCEPSVGAYFMSTLLWSNQYA